MQLIQSQLRSWKQEKIVIFAKLIDYRYIYLKKDNSNKWLNFLLTENKTDWPSDRSTVDVVQVIPRTLFSLRASWRGKHFNHLMAVPISDEWADLHVSQSLFFWFMYFINILCWLPLCLWGQIDKAEQVQCLKLHRGVGCGQSAGHMADESNKLTLRRLEAPIHKFIKVALPTDLERLQKHHNNILKVTAEKSGWTHDVTSTLVLPVNRWTTHTFLLHFHSTNTASNGTAFIRSTSTPAELFRYHTRHCLKAPVTGLTILYTWKPWSYVIFSW